MIGQLSLFALLAVAQIATAPVQPVPVPRGLPPAYDSAVVLTADNVAGMDSVLAVLKTDIEAAFPDVAERHRQSTPQEWQAFLQSAGAESLRAALRSRVPGIIGRTYLLRFPGLFPEYNIQFQSFLMSVYWGKWVLNSTPDRLDESRLATPHVPDYTADDLVVINREGRHVAGGAWFDSLPLIIHPRNNGLNIVSLLAVQVPDPAAVLSMRRISGNLVLWLGFRLTGAVKTSKSAQYDGGSFPVAKDAVMMVTDRTTGELVWSHEYNGPDADPAKPKPRPRHRGCW